MICVTLWPGGTQISDAVSFCAHDKAAIGKAADDKTIEEIQAFELNGARLTSGGNGLDGSALKEAFNPRVEEDLHKIINWLDGHTEAWTTLLDDDVETLADMIAATWSDAQECLLRNAHSLHAHGKAAIGKAACNETIQIEAIELNGARPTSGENSFDGSALKELINPHVNEDLDTIIKVLNGHELRLGQLSTMMMLSLLPT